MKKKEIISKLYEIGAIKFGQYKLKNQMISPIYIDLRLLVSHPKLLKAIASLLAPLIQKIPYDILCGVPYGALPIAQALSFLLDKPMIMLRKEIKDHGTKKLIEGAYQTNQSCLIVEDLITSGISIKETIQTIDNAGINIKDILVLIDREQGGVSSLKSQGYHVHALFTLTEILDELVHMNKIDDETALFVKDFIKDHQNSKACL